MTEPVAVVLPGSLVDAIERAIQPGGDALVGLNQVASIGERVCALYEREVYSREHTPTRSSSVEALMGLLPASMTRAEWSALSVACASRALRAERGSIAPGAATSEVAQVVEAVEVDAITLKPRAVEALIALRSGPMSSMQIRRALRDRSIAGTNSLLSDMKRESMIAHLDPTSAAATWRLDDRGLAWLRDRGLLSE